MSVHDEFLARIQQKGCALLSVSWPEIHDVENFHYW